MNFRQMSDDQIALILMGLRAIYVEDQKVLRQKMEDACVAELAARGKRLAA